MRDTPLLELRELTSQLTSKDGVVRAADGVSFAVQHGEILGLVGESGSGKSVTAMSIMRLLESGWRSTGEVLFDGQNLLSLSEREMLHVRGKQIGMIFQDPATSLDPVATVAAQLAESLDQSYYDSWRGNLLSGAWHMVRRWLGAERRTRRELHARTIDLLRSVHLPNPAARMEEYPYMLSGGMIQRIMIAIALAGRPRMLIADEPTTALDVTIQAQILDLLRSQQRDSDLAILLITHDLGVVAEMCDRVAVMYAGRIVEIASAAELFASPRHPYTIGLLRSMPDPDHPAERLTAIDGTVPALVNLAEAECHFHTRCPFAIEICRRERPPLIAAEGSHPVACHLYSGDQPPPDLGYATARAAAGVG